MVPPLIERSEVCIKSGGTKDHLMRVKVPGTAPY